MSSTVSRFDGRAEAYASARPAYAPALMEWLQSAYHLGPGSVVADIGAGTGKFTTQLLALGATVYAVEPNAEMRAQAEIFLKESKRLQILEGTASATTLPEHHFDFVCAAQAFHWFDVTAFQKECRRLLKPDGLVVLVWNTREATAPVNKAWAAVYARYCPEFKGFMNGLQSDDAKIQKFFAGQYVHKVFPAPLHFDQEGFIRRSLSSSYSLKPGEPNFDAYIESLQKVFAAYAEEGVIAIANISEAYVGQPG